jgi:hypothetical protein
MISGKSREAGRQDSGRPKKVSFIRKKLYFIRAEEERYNLLASSPDRPNPEFLSSF